MSSHAGRALRCRVMRGGSVTQLRGRRQPCLSLAESARKSPDNRRGRIRPHRRSESDRGLLRESLTSEIALADGPGWKDVAVPKPFPRESRRHPMPAASCCVRSAGWCPPVSTSKFRALCYTDRCRAMARLADDDPPTRIATNPDDFRRACAVPDRCDRDIPGVRPAADGDVGPGSGWSRSWWG